MRKLNYDEKNSIKIVNKKYIKLKIKIYVYINLVTSITGHSNVLALKFIFIFSIHWL